MCVCVMTRKSIDLTSPHRDGPVERRRKISVSDVQREQRSIACERVKTNVIYMLIMLCVVLIGVLCYTLVIIFEEHSDVLEPTPESERPTIGGGSFDRMPEEQRRWYENAQRELSDSIQFVENNGKAKNVILFVGDGMGLSTVTAARILKYKEEGRLTWELFPHFGLLKVIIPQFFRHTLCGWLIFFVCGRNYTVEMNNVYVF